MNTGVHCSTEPDSLSESSGDLQTPHGCRFCSYSGSRTEICAFYRSRKKITSVCHAVFTLEKGRLNECVCVCVIGECWPDALLPFSGIICLKLSTLRLAK